VKADFGVCTYNFVTDPYLSAVEVGSRLKAIHYKRTFLRFLSSAITDVETFTFTSDDLHVYLYYHNYILRGLVCCCS